ncbi:MAG: DUF3095 domain-containing protein [Pseudomonadota bacterium]
MTNALAQLAEFQASIPLQERFDRLADPDTYRTLPDGWIIGAADIVGSTDAIARGLYKTVNTIGAAVISAQINAVEGTALPFAFGGDGAVFALPGTLRERCEKALSEVIRWADTEFGMGLRAAIVPIEDVRAAGCEVGVARYKASPGIEYTMFRGGGMHFADDQMKEGGYGVDAAPPGSFPDLTGLSCRWTPMQSQNGQILSVLVLPQSAELTDDHAKLYHDILDLARSLDRSGHPVPPTGPGFEWPPEGLALEAHASRGKRSLAVRKAQLLLETFIALVFFKTKIKMGSFDPVHYIYTSGINADFRKFDDGLKMTIDCDVETETRIRDRLEQAHQAGLVRYAIHAQDQAIMTCIVPSVTADDHVHFVDGASGGYAKAAEQLKVRPG